MSHKLPTPNCGSHERTRLAGLPGKPYRVAAIDEQLNLQSSTTGA